MLEMEAAALWLPQSSELTVQQQLCGYTEILLFRRREI